MPGKQETGWDNPFAPKSPFYQVKPNDTSMIDAANNLGINLNSLVDLNGGMKSLPPVGSYIVAAPQGATLPQGAGPIPNVPAPGQYQNPAGPAAPTTAAAPSLLYTHEKQKAVIDITQSLKSGVLPSVIPFNVSGGVVNPVTGQPFTKNDYLAAGYVADPTTNTYKLKNGAGGANQSGGAGNTDFANTASQQYYKQNNISFYNQDRWDPSVGEFVKIGDLIRQGKLDERTGQFNPYGYGGGGGGSTKKAQPRVNQGGTAQTVLSLHLGSG